MEAEESLKKEATKSHKGKLTDEAAAPAAGAAATSEKKGIWNWKPIRALTHIGMQKLSCLFSVEVVAVQGLPASMNGLRLSVCVRKKDSREAGVQTMPSRVSQGAADFEETLFVRTHVYFTPGSGTHMKFEPRPFSIYVVAVDADELDFGRKTVDLSGLIQESIEKSFEGTRIRQWDTTFSLSGKAKGGELVLKLGFQIMEKDGGVGIYSQAEGQRLGKTRTFSPSIARKQSKTSFSVPSPRMTSRSEAWTPNQKGAGSEDLAMDDLNLDEPAPPPAPAAAAAAAEPESRADDNDLPDFDVEDKGVEFLDEEGESSDKRSVSSEVVKEVVQDQSHVTRLSELDSIAQQIKALESIMGDETTLKIDEETTSSQALDADEDKVTREFLQMLEDGGGGGDYADTGMQPLKLDSYEEAEEAEAEVFLPDLGKGLGCVVQTRNGGYLAAANPFDTAVAKTDTPKLALQLSKPMVIQSGNTGFEIFQKLAALGLEKLASEALSLMPLDELSGKTAEQIAFEGIANVIIQGRNKEGANSNAARTVASVKSMANAMSGGGGRKERVSSGIWNVSEDPLTVEDILAFSMQKIESMAVEGVKIQAEVANEEAPFDVSPLDHHNNILSSAKGVEDWIKESHNTEAITLAVVVQLRDPVRQFEAVGGPMVALIHAEACNEGGEEEEERYKVGSLQVGGMKVRSGGVKTGWDTEKQRLTALQWLIASGIGKAGKKGKRVVSKGPDVFWSISSRIMADMWLKPIRNPDVKFSTK